eukprot:56682-Pyramimonas_sp.AAC.1
MITVTTAWAMEGFLRCGNLSKSPLSQLCEVWRLAPSSLLSSPYAADVMDATNIAFRIDVTLRSKKLGFE